MIIGSLYATFREPHPLPLSVAGCATNITRPPVTASTDYPFSFFNLSYLYLTPFCLLVGFVVATVVSLLTGESLAGEMYRVVRGVSGEGKREKLGDKERHLVSSVVVRLRRKTTSLGGWPSGPR